MTAERGWVLQIRPRRRGPPNTVLLLASSAVASSRSGVLPRHRRKVLSPSAGRSSWGRILGDPWYEWHLKPFGLGTSSYASLYFLTTRDPHRARMIGLLILVAIFVWDGLDYFSPRRRLTMSAGVLYWHFVDRVWLFVFGTYYVSPYLGFAR